MKVLNEMEDNWLSSMFWFVRFSFSKKNCIATFSLLEASKPSSDDMARYRVRIRWTIKQMKSMTRLSPFGFLLLFIWIRDKIVYSRKWIRLATRVRAQSMLIVGKIKIIHQTVCFTGCHFYGTCFKKSSIFLERTSHKILTATEICFVCFCMIFCRKLACKQQKNNNKRHRYIQR